MNFIFFLIQSTFLKIAIQQQNLKIFKLKLSETYSFSMTSSKLIFYFFFVDLYQLVILSRTKKLQSLEAMQENTQIIEFSPKKQNSILLKPEVEKQVDRQKFNNSQQRDINIQTGIQAKLQDRAENYKKYLKLSTEDKFMHKMNQIKQKPFKYNRSTNNCHKKYMCATKAALIKYLDSKDLQFLEQFNKHQNSRAYYFILLVLARQRLSKQCQCYMTTQVMKNLQQKKEKYSKEIQLATEEKYKQFRRDELHQMSYAIQSYHVFMEGQTKRAIKILYKKGKDFVTKKAQYLNAVMIAEKVEEKLRKKLKQNNSEVKIEFDEMPMIKRKESSFKLQNKDFSAMVEQNIIKVEEINLKQIPKSRSTEYPMFEAPLLHLSYSYPPYFIFDPLHNVFIKNSDLRGTTDVQEKDFQKEKVIQK